MAVGQLLLTYPSRHTWMRPLANRYLHGAVALGVLVQLAAAAIPFLADMLGDAAIPTELWAVVAGGAMMAWALAEAIARVVWRAASETDRG
jgi:Ca2+-transporting ATPase